MEVTKTNWFKKIHFSIISGMSAIGAIWTFLLMVIIIVDVIGRYFFNSPLTGTMEIIKNSIVGITFLQLAQVLKVNRHIRTTIFMDRVSPSLHKLLAINSNLLGAFLMVLIIYSNWNTTWNALINREFEMEGILRIYTFPVHFLVLLGSFFLLIQFIISIIDTIYSKPNRTESDREV